MYVIVKVITQLLSEITPFADQVRIRLISQLIEEKVTQVF